MSDSESISANSEKYSCSGVSSTTEDVSSSTGTGQNLSAKEELAAQETKQIKLSRAIFIALLLIITAAAGTSTYILSRGSEQKKIEDDVSAVTFPHTAQDCHFILTFMLYDNVSTSY